MLRPESEYELLSCPKGQKDPDKGEVRTVAIDESGKCSFAYKCVILCEYKKSKFSLRV